MIGENSDQEPLLTHETTDSKGNSVEKSLDECLKDVKVSWFQYRLLLLCGLMFTADSMEVMLLSFLSICAGADFDLSHAEVASISSAVFAGELLGSTVWGPVADMYGRRTAFVAASLTMTVGGLLSGVAPDFASLLAFRGICGFGVGGVTVPFDLMAEFLPASERGHFLMMIEYFWTAGSVFVVCMAWAVLRVYSWRVLAVTTCIPVGLACLLGYLYLPESARWLLQQRRVEEAEEVVASAARMNGVELGAFTLALPPTTNSGGRANEAAGMYATFAALFGADMVGVTIPLVVVYLTYAFLYNGIIFFVSRLYNAQDDSGAYVCAFNYPPIMANSASEVVGITLTLLFINHIGRIPVQWGSYFVGGVSVLLLGFMSGGQSGALLVMVCGFVARSAAMTATCATWISTPELYPTHLRASAHAYCHMLSRLSAFAAPYVVFSELSDSAVGIVLCVANVLAAVASAFLPETARRSMDDLDA